METIIIKQSKSKQLKLFFYGIIMLLSSLLVYIFPHYLEDIAVFRWIGVVGLIFFGLCFIFITKRLITPKAILIIDEKGFTDNSSAASIGFVSWASVEHIELTSVASQQFISIALNETAKIEIPRFKKILMNLNTSLGYPKVSITLQATNENNEDILKLMRKYLVAYRTGQLYSY